MERLYISSTPAEEALLRDIISCVERLPEEAVRGSVDGWDYRLIYKGRNRIYRLTGRRGQGDFAVKCFGVLSWWRRIYYSWVGTSKAKRSYLHTRELEERGISTPKALGYVEEYTDYAILKRSYYVCAWVETEGSSIHPHMGGTATPEGFLPALAHFLTEVHRQGIEHLDLSPGNVLYNRRSDGAYQFYLVDVNRMEFSSRPLSLSQSLKNIDRLVWNSSVSTALAYYYALERGGEIEAETNDLGASGRGDLSEYIQAIVNRYNRYCDRFWERRLVKLIVRYNKQERHISSFRTLRSIRIFYTLALLWQYLPAGSLREYIYRKMSALYIDRLSFQDLRQVIRRRYGFGYRLSDHLLRP